MDEMLENIVGRTTQSLTPWGCARNCVSLLVAGAILYVVLVIVFIFMQGGFQF